MFNFLSRLLIGFLAVFTIVPSVLLSQVKIKEKVEIGSHAALKSMLSVAGTASGPAFITAPRKGHLSITFSNAVNQYVPMTPGAFLQVRVSQRSDTIPVRENFQSVTQYIPSAFDKFRYGCRYQDDPFVIYNYEEPVNKQYYVNVNAGDAVYFSYHGEAITPSDDLYKGGNTWSVRMRGINPLLNQCVNPGNAVKFEALWIWVVFVDEIQVGESRYYYLAGNDDDGWGFMDDWKPGFPEPVRKTDVTYDVQPAVPADTLPIRWEVRTSLPGDPAKMLPNGIIRVIGNHFDPSDRQNNMVQLTANFMTSYGEDYTSIDIEVKKNKELKILDHAPWSIWPSLPPRRGADRPGYDPKRSFRIQVLDASNQPVKDEQVRIFTSFEDRSGGHQHALGTVSLPQPKQGYFYGQGKPKENPLLLTTDQNGVAVVDSIVASQVAGNYLVTASLVADTTIKDTVNMEMKVPDLVNFRYLIVLQDMPYVLAQSDTGGSRHPDNDWCTAETGNSLFLAILDFYEWTRAVNGVAGPTKTSVNDMSLKWGGYFDTRANWDFDGPKPEHRLHRVGTSIDINHGVMDKEKLAKLTYYVSRHGGRRDRERPQIHYEFH
jgi:hypothetical protein